MPSIVPHFDFRISFGVATDQGKRREAMEDAHLAAPELSLFAVADGMGGHAGGEVAATLALEELRRSIASDSAQRLIQRYVSSPELSIRRRVFNCLRLAVERANHRVREEAAARPELAGMGTTLDVAWLARDRAFLAHAGDSRAYLSRASATLQLTQDHGQLESLKAEGKLHADAKQTSHNRLLNAVGLTDAVQVDTLFVQLARGDRLLLCSDGVHGQINGEGRLGELFRGGSAQAAAGALIAEAAAQGRDNATALIIALADRFVQRAEIDRGLAPSDLDGARSSPLLTGLPLPQVLATLAAAVEIEVGSEEAVPQVVTSDRVAYIILEGVVRCPGGRTVGPGALLFPESLVGVVGREALPIVDQRARLLRLRADDFQEICDTDPELSARLFKNLAQHLARLKVPGANG